MARPIRIEYRGAVYHVICRGNNRQAVFRDDQDRKKYLERLSLYCGEKGVDLLCYCLLTNHIHLLLETPRGNLSKMMQPFQTSYTIYFNKRHGRTGHVFEQRYKALLVDKDNYLLEVSRYIHVNPVAAKLVERAEDYPWSSYGGYCTGKGIPRLKRETVLDYFNGGRQRQVVQYREFVEGILGGKQNWGEPPVLKQAFVGDEDFVEEAKKRAANPLVWEGHHSLKRIVRAVCQVCEVEEREIRRPKRSPEIHAAREILCYLSRRRSDVGLRELARFLGVKELSTPSHGARRAEERAKKDDLFRRQLDRVTTLFHTCGDTPKRQSR
jgi:REP element-mobilizing transposase RayT